MARDTLCYCVRVCFSHWYYGGRWFLFAHFTTHSSSGILSVWQRSWLLPGKSLLGRCPSDARKLSLVWHKKGLFWDFSLVLLPPSFPKMPEEETFCVFTHLMYHYRLRELYKPSMADLALFFYQLECLVEVSHVHCPRALHACRLSHWGQLGLMCGHIIVQRFTCSLFQLSSPHYLWS